MGNVRPMDAKNFIMGSALMLTGVMECLEQIEEGKGLFESATTAVQLTKKRGAVLKEAADDRAYSHILGPARYSGRQAAKTAHDQINRNSSLRGCRQCPSHR